MFSYFLHDTRAGPSQGSIRAEKYSYKAFLSGSMFISLCHASGIIIITASGKLLPDRMRSSRTLSNAPESEEVASTIGRSFDISSLDRPSSLHFKRPSRAFIQFLFPLRVLISPLCPKTRIGCARSQLGKVFVENLECTSHVTCEASVT